MPLKFTRASSIMIVCVLPTADILPFLILAHWSFRSATKFRICSSFSCRHKKNIILEKLVANHNVTVQVSNLIPLLSLWILIAEKLNTNEILAKNQSLVKRGDNYVLFENMNHLKWLSNQPMKTSWKSIVKFKITYSTYLLVGQTK